MRWEMVDLDQQVACDFDGILHILYFHWDDVTLTWEIIPEEYNPMPWFFHSSYIPYDQHHGG
jgi:hypothetical protein